MHRHQVGRVGNMLLGIVLIAGVLALPPPPVARADHQPQAIAADFELVPILSTMYFPVAARLAPDGRVFVIDKTGLVYGFDSISDTTHTIVAALHDRVNAHQERGMFGLAVDPGFPDRPYIYVSYSAEPVPSWNDVCASATNGCVTHGRISRLEVSAGNTLVGSERVLLDGLWCQQYGHHGPAALAFGPEGALYASAGDGTTPTFADRGQRGNPCGDPPFEGGALRSQDLRTPGDPIGYSGGIIRIHPDTGAPWPDNAGAGTLEERRLIAYGFRNPYRMAFEPGTGQLWVADVGLHEFEEMNVVRPTGPVSNHGWPCYEGDRRQPVYTAAGIPLCQSLGAGAVTDPFFAYRHGGHPDQGNCAAPRSAISAIGFYDTGSYPAVYDGSVWFADYPSSCLSVMTRGTNGRPDPATLHTIAVDIPVLDIQPGPNGDLIIVTGEWEVPRRIYLLRHRLAPVAVMEASRTHGPAPVAVDFDATSSTSPDGQPLAYSWDLDGDGDYDDAAGATVTGSYTATQTVVGLLATHPSGARATASTVIFGHDKPVVTIAAPAPGAGYAIGDAIAFSGSALDHEDGSLGPSAFRWELVLDNCAVAGCPEQVVAESAGVTSGSFTVPDHVLPSTLSLRVAAGDSGGLSGNASVALDPIVSDLAFVSEPAGATMVVNGVVGLTPFVRPAVVGSANDVLVPSPQHLAAAGYTFTEWAHGGPRNQTIVAPAGGVTYTAKMVAGLVPPTAVGAADPSTGEWHLRKGDGSPHSFFFGNPDDAAFVGDWDCDGIETPGLYRSSDGFVYLENANRSAVADVEFFFGNPGDVPLAGDFDGDGCDSVSLYRPGQGQIFIINRLGDFKGGLGPADFEFIFGNPGDVPFVGDFDGNGIDEIGLHRAETGFVYFRYSLTTGNADHAYFYGDPGDTIVTGDWTGVARDTLGVHRPSAATFYLRHTLSPGVADLEIPFGDSSMTGIAGRFGLDL